NRPDTYERLPQPRQVLHCEQQPAHTLGLCASGAKQFLDDRFCPIRAVLLMKEEVLIGKEGHFGVQT
ncbi:hypothetical protein, partial [Paracoccus marcusii]|uniref:hypothetical protein n=1 Tax=Paracoccus marcusii TaxID=59779 RepID=UPI00248FF474